MAGVDDLCMAWWKSNKDKADTFKALEGYLKTFEKSLKAAQKKDDAKLWADCQRAFGTLEEELLAISKTTDGRWSCVSRAFRARQSPSRARMSVAGRQCSLPGCG